jgi:hypothetical protein
MAKRQQSPIGSSKGMPFITRFPAQNAPVSAASDAPDKEEIPPNRPPMEEPGKEPPPAKEPPKRKPPAPIEEPGKDPPAGDPPPKTPPIRVHKS